MTTHEIIVRAHALLSEHGVIKHEFGSPGEGFCARGAYMFAEHGEARMSLINFQVEQALGRAAGIEPYHPFADRNIACWTNEPERTEEEVLAVFEQAAADTAPPYDWNAPADLSPQGIAEMLAQMDRGRVLA